MFCIEFSQILMVIERTLATCLFVCYERTTKTIGYMLTSVAIVMPLSTCAYMYYDDEFNYPQMSSLSTSPHSWAKINYLFLTLTVLNFLTLMHSIGLYRHNQRKVRVAENGDHLGLSSRYQLNENVVSSRLLWWMSTAQLGIFLTYGVSMYSLRLLLTGPRSAGWQAFTELCYVS
uniref:Uncharacterized protein n=2 Tax=Caenorhabditis japonica TaxID=281687 RepID=A0A8R1DSG7_CAEJA